MSVESRAGRDAGNFDISDERDSRTAADKRHWAETVVTVMLTTVAVLMVSFMAVLMGLA